MKWFRARLSEPSTWAGLAVFVGHIAPAVATGNAVAIIGSVAGALAVVFPEKSGA